MLQTSEDESLSKLKGFLREKKPQLNNEEIDKISNQLYELAVFLVRLKIKKHHKEDDDVLTVETDKPP